MKLRHLICVAVTGLTLSLPVAATEPDPFDTLDALMNPEVLFRDVIREDDVSLLFKHVRESIAASARGEEAPNSEEFNKRTETIGREMAVRGSVLLGVLLNAFEAKAKQVIREEFGVSVPRTPQRRVSPVPGSSD